MENRKKYMAPALYKTKGSEVRNIVFFQTVDDVRAANYNSKYTGDIYSTWVCEYNFRLYQILYKMIYKRKYAGRRSDTLRIMYNTEARRFKRALEKHYKYPNKTNREPRKYNDENYYPFSYRYFYTIFHNNEIEDKNLWKRFDKKLGKNSIIKYTTRINNIPITKKEIMRRYWNDKNKENG